DMDVYVAALRIPDLIFNLLILGTLSVAFIPVFVGYVKRDSPETSVIASTIFNITLLVMIFFVTAGIIFAPILIKVIAPGFSMEAAASAIAMTRILLLSPLLFSLSSILTSILHSYKRFLVAAIAPLLYNLSIIFGAIYVYPKFGLSGLAWTVVLGAFLHMLLQLPLSLKLGLRPLRFLDIHHEGVKKIAKLFLPRILALDLGQISLLIATVIGSALTVGSLSGFYYAFELETVPVGIFAMSFAIASFPTMAEFFEKNDIVGFKRFFSVTTVQILFFIIPISVLMLLLRAQIVRLVPGAIEGTRFTFADTALTASSLGFFVLSLFAQSLVPLLARAFFAFQNTITPLIISSIAAVINITAAIFLSRQFGSAGLAMAFSIASIVQMVILVAALRRRLGDLEDDFVILRVLKISIASVLMAIVAYLTLYAVAPLVDMQTYLGVLIQTLSAIVVAVFVYLMSGRVIGLPETHQTIEIIKIWFNKLSRPITSAIVSMFDP
ncbi:MAG: murein biosynthesis integral membrane protein MurJ, partial [bacterium]|nr:murein biosynthesis integral membrane protein MurJ [bacterium]